MFKDDEFLGALGIQGSIVFLDELMISKVAGFKRVITSRFDQFILNTFYHEKNINSILKKTRQNNKISRLLIMREEDHEVIVDLTVTFDHLEIKASLAEWIKAKIVFNIIKGE